MSYRSSGSDAAAPEVQSREAFEAVVADSKPVLVDFYAEWCGPCRLMADIVDELAAETDRPVVKVDAETLPSVAEQYDIHGVPAFVAFEESEPIGRLVGMQDKVDLKALLE